MFGFDSCSFLTSFLRDPCGQIDRALAAEEGTAAEGRYRETDEAGYDLWVMRATSRKQMGEPKEPERPDRSMFA